MNFVHSPIESGKSAAWWSRDRHTTADSWLWKKLGTMHKSQLLGLFWYESTGLELTYENSYGWPFYIPIGIPMCHLGSNLPIHKPRCWGPFPRDGLRQATHFGSIEDQNFLFRPRAQDWLVAGLRKIEEISPILGHPKPGRDSILDHCFVRTFAIWGRDYVYISQAARVKRDCNMVCGCLWSSIPYW